MARAQAVPRRVDSECGCLPIDIPMDLDEFIDNAAVYLQDAGIAYSLDMDEWLEGLRKRGIKPHQVVTEYRSKDKA
jgi:hypothetical protein